jgi:hypothetical protein
VAVAIVQYIYGGEQTEKIIAADERLAKAMEDSVKEAGDSLRTTQQSFRDDQRPWIAIWHAHMYFESQIPLGAQLEIVNVGKTPALHVTKAASRFIWRPPILSGPTPKLINELAFQDAAPIPPQGKTAISMGDANQQQPLAVDWVSIKSGAQILYSFGEIRYEDTFGRKHSTKFCFYLTNPGTTNVVAFCKGYNDME